jgi:hypothetical protein
MKEFAMSYIEDLVTGNAKSIADMLKNALGGDFVQYEHIVTALKSEVAPVAAGGNIYDLTENSLNFISLVSKSPDRDMLIIVKKILRSTKYAATTYYSVAGLDDNPHRLPIYPQGGYSVNG